MYIVINDVALIVTRLLHDEDATRMIMYSPEQVEYDFDMMTLMQCISLAIAEIFGDGFAVYHTDTYTAYADCLIKPYMFYGDLLAVKSVKRDGVDVKYTFDSSGVHVPSPGKYEIEYTISPSDVPTEKMLFETIETGATVDKELVAYLAARNFCLVLGRTDEAAIWDQRYIRESENKRLKRKSRLPAREWR